MACYHPITAYQGSGNRLVFSPLEHRYGDLILKQKEIKIPCGQCIGCRLDRSRTWALRCMHELKSHSESCFITLTYNKEHLPPNGSLRPDDMVKFLKRLRFHLDQDGKKIRYFQCGEYGDEHGRPHHHAIIFGWRPDDLKFFRISSGQKLYISKFLEETWGNGYCVVGDVTFDSCAYVARYILKKHTGIGAKEYYEELGKIPEFVTMSRRPGLGREFYETYKDDIYANDFCFDGKRYRIKPPKYYDKLYHHERELDFFRVKQNRLKNVRELSQEDLDRLRSVKHHICFKLKRRYEKHGELKRDD